MKIAFNANRVQNVNAGQPIARKSVTATASDTELSSKAAELASKLDAVPLSRPDKVAQAKTYVSDGKYPPDDLLDRIAVLLATNK